MKFDKKETMEIYDIKNNWNKWNYEWVHNVSSAQVGSNFDAGWALALNGCLDEC